MPEPSDSTPEHSEIADCPSLMAVCTQQLYRHNAFRVLNIAVDAGLREILRQTDKLLKHAEFGGDRVPNATPSFGMPPPMVEEIRAAAERLKEPELRLVDEMFWLWPVTGESSTDPILKAFHGGDQDGAISLWEEMESGRGEGATAAAHNLAVINHIQAMNSPPYETGDEVNLLAARLWQASIDRWTRLTRDQRLWDWVRNRIRTIDDPRLTSGMAWRMENVLPDALARINAEMAIACENAGMKVWSQQHMSYLRSLETRPEVTAKTVGALLSPLRDRILREVASARDSVAQAKPIEGVAIVRRMLTECQRPLPLFDLLYGPEAHQRIELFDEVAVAGADMLWKAKRERIPHAAVAPALAQMLSMASTRHVQSCIHEHSLSPLFALLDTIKAMAEQPSSPTHPMSKIMYGRMRLQVFAELARLSPLISNDSTFMDRFRDACAVSLQSVLYHAAITDRNPTMAKEILQVATGIAIASSIKAELAKDLKVVEAMQGKSPCECCGKNQASPSHILTLKLATPKDSSVLYVPRCRPCWAAQNPQRVWTIRCFLAGAIVAPLLGPIVAATGASVALLWMGFRWVRKLSAYNATFVVFGVLMILLSAMLMWTTIEKGITQSSSFRDVPWQILGGGMTCAAAAKLLAWINQPKMDATLKDHVEYQAWAKKGYQIVNS